MKVKKNKTYKVQIRLTEHENDLLNYCVKKTGKTKTEILTTFLYRCNYENNKTLNNN